MGTVWRAWDERLKRAVAVKEVLVPDGMPPDESERLRERYLREARAAARLRHPAVVGVYDVISEQGRVWIVMELVASRDLAAIIRTDGPLDPVSAAKIGMQLLDALDAAHTAGVLHRDVKPANVLICADNRAVLTDFGVASVTGDASLTRTGQLVGSPAYLAPERVTGGRVGPPTDLWSLGCTLYAAVQGRPPFARDEQFAIIAAITLEPIPEPTGAGPLAPVLYGLLEKDVTERWDSRRTRRALGMIIAGKEVDPMPGWGSPSAEPVTMVQNAVIPRQSSPVIAAPVEERDTDGGDGALSALMGSRHTVHADIQPAPPKRRSRGRGVLLTLLILLVIAGVAAGGAWVYRPDAVRQLLHLRAASPSPSEGPVALPSPVPSPSPSPPAGIGATKPFRNADLGYSLEIPASWSSRCELPEDKAACRFNALSGSDRFNNDLINTSNNLYVAVKPAGGLDALGLAKQENKRWQKDPSTSTDYVTRQLKWTSIGKYSGSVLEFTFTHPVNGPRRVLIFRTVAHGDSYEVSLNCPAATFKQDSAAFDRAVESFQITGS
jgi:serine/threonine protein kinase